jgi:putative SOS response-associated peptidase YedK
MALAGLWENWQSPAGDWIRTFAVITTPPNELCAELHNRMPAVLKPEMWPAWLGEEPATVPDRFKNTLRIAGVPAWMLRYYTQNALKRCWPPYPSAA